ncbi:MAG: hypothetical protein GY795_46890 [Desulfobacterales bacterium]|nr:hypothetical protein [Desulfobacterales bacterium]
MIKKNMVARGCILGLLVVVICGYFEESSATTPQTSIPFIDITSSFNPLGAGARAIGMGGAFIAVANDATAASWNPGGLPQLKLPEISIVTSGFHLKEDINFGRNPEAIGSHSISDENINYLSATYPFELLNYNMVLSLSYQHLYDFNREWQFVLKQRDENVTELMSFESIWNYQQKGRLSALGLSYGIRVLPQLSMGITLNIWRDGLTDNNWEHRSQMTGSGEFFPFDVQFFQPFTEQLDQIETYSFKGFNVNLGMLWRVSYHLTIGAVFKTPFTADVEHSIQSNWKHQEFGIESAKSKSDIINEELEMPMSYGIGFVYNFSDHFSMSADIYKTEWDDFISRDKAGEERYPISGKLVSESEIDPTHQIRMGAEYRHINKQKGYIIPIRCGIFYDPAPSEGSPDDYYGFSLGMGLAWKNRFSLDIAYQYRFGNDVGSYLLEDIYEFSQDVNEHMVYLSMILYSF